MSAENPEQSSFFVDACDAVAQRSTREGIESLSSIERTVFRVYVFDTDQQMGGLTAFFYNTDSSPVVASETADALDSIGASRTASLLREAASFICRPSLQQGARTWKECLERVDPESRLDTVCEQISQIGEVYDLLKPFVQVHRDEIHLNNA